MDIAVTTFLSTLFASILFWVIKDFGYTWYCEKKNGKFQIAKVYFCNDIIYGQSINVAIKNVTNHNIAVEEVMIVTVNDGKYSRLYIKKYDEPLNIKPLEVKKIIGNRNSQFLFSRSDIDNLNFGFQEPSGTIIWAKRHGKCNQKELNRLHKENLFGSFLLVNQSYKGTILSEKIKRVVVLKRYDEMYGTIEETLYVMSNGAIYDNQKRVYQMTQEEYNNQQLFLEWFRHNFNVYCGLIRIVEFDK